MKKTPLKRRTPLKRKAWTRSSSKPMKRSRIPRVSAKMALATKAYRCMADAFLESHPHCEVCCEDNPLARNLWKRSKEVHHKRGRTAGLLIDVRFFMAICRYHHQQIHDHTAWARERGYIGNRDSKAMRVEGIE